MTERQPIVVVMGVSGVGKSTVARALAQRFDGAFLEADEFHPPENIAAMANGTPLNDALRWGWLQSVCTAAMQGEAPVFIACSALKRRYRDFMRERLDDMIVIHLYGAADVILARMKRRKNHFMPPRMLDSQFHDLEPPTFAEGGVARVDVSANIGDVINTAATAYHRLVGSAEMPPPTRPPAPSCNETTTDP